MQIAELISSLADAKIEIAEIQTQLREKDKIIEVLNDKINTKNSIVWEKPYYWLKNEDKKDGPFCQQCYDNTQKLIRLQGGGTNAWYCQTCKSRVTDSNYVVRKIRRSSRGVTF